MNFLERNLEDPVRFARVKRLFYIALGIVVVAEILVLLLSLGHPHFAFEKVPAFGSLYGFASCVVIIVVSKLIGKVWLSRKEDHYDS